MLLGSLSLPVALKAPKARRRDGESSDRGMVPSIGPGIGLGRIVCTVDGGPVGHRAIRQAIALCPRDGGIDFIAPLSGAAPPAEERRLRMALDGAVRMATAAQRHATTSLRRADRPSEALLSGGAEGEPIVMAATDRPDEPGLGRLATEVAHRCPRPVLLARRSVGSERFPTRVLLATDGSPGSWNAARACADIVAARGGRLDLIRVSEGGEAASDQVREQVHMLELRGAAPDNILERPGDVPGRICQTASNDHASLLVLGRGSTADRARLGDVAESVAHRAGCSVLLAAAHLPDPRAEAGPDACRHRDPRR